MTWGKHTGLWNRPSEAQTEPCAPGPRGKEQWSHKRLTQTCLCMSRSLQHRCGLVVACFRVGGTECSSTCMGPLKTVAIIFITSTIVWPWVSNREETQLHPSTEDWIKDLLSMALPIRTGPSFPSVSLSYQEASISLLSFSIRGQTDWKPQSQKTNQSDYMTIALSNSMKLWAMLCECSEVTQSCPTLSDPVDCM